MTTAPTTTSTWAIDAAHSIAEFSVKHMLVSTVKGRFGAVAGTLAIDESEPIRSSVTATIEVASIDTGQAQRDEHLRSDDFFAAEQFPTITFRSTRVERKNDEEWRVSGDLTIRDLTRPVTLATEFEGQLRDAYGRQRAAFTATTELSRKEFGLKWNALLESGGAVVGDKVKVTLHIAAVRQDQS